MVHRSQYTMLGCRKPGVDADEPCHPLQGTLKGKDTLK